ncbi:Maf-like protein [Rhizobium sp. FKY42]|uniref:Maf-like protein n=1 Tax=Rhizobium sp. FKY42 TaxID=2562310 RepID=UPI0010C0ADCC|nr:Maf-like protein [Rhizobium sp. FKY42]
MQPKLILASSSPFRRSLMENAGLTFDWSAANIDERKIEADLQQCAAGPREVAQHLSRAKAMDVSQRYPDAFVIGSDQTMSLGERVFHKPKDRQDAKATLIALSGHVHHLNSGISIVRSGHVEWEGVFSASLHVRELSDQFIEHYLDRVGDRVMGSVGAYQLEGEGIHLFSNINGDYFTILGLPMLPLLEALRNLGVIDV